MQHTGVGWLEGGKVVSERPRSSLAFLFYSNGRPWGPFCSRSWPPHGWQEKNSPNTVGVTVSDLREACLRSGAPVKPEPKEGNTSEEAKRAPAGGGDWQQPGRVIATRVDCPGPHRRGTGTLVPGAASGPLACFGHCARCGVT